MRVFACACYVCGFVCVCVIVCGCVCDCVWVCVCVCACVCVWVRVCGGVRAYVHTCSVVLASTAIEIQCNFKLLMPTHVCGNTCMTRS